jgi:hypothetical protein
MKGQIQRLMNMKMRIAGLWYRANDRLEEMIFGVVPRQVEMLEASRERFSID